MFGSVILDVSIGIILVYLFLSIICSALTEWLSGMLKLRAKNLEEGIRSLLDDPAGGGLAAQFFNHPLVRGLSKKEQNPSYIPSRIFAITLMDIIAPVKPDEGSRTIKEFQESVGKLPFTNLQKSISTLINQAENDLKTARGGIERWFDDAMDRASGWYKRKSQLIIFICAVVVSVMLNVDTLSIWNTLFRDPTMRAGLVAAAQETVKQPLASTAGDIEKKLTEMNETIKFPIGWNESPLKLFDHPWRWLTKAVGLLITALAVSLGAPFWFDVLNKVINLRSAGTRPERT